MIRKTQKAIMRMLRRAIPKFTSAQKWVKILLRQKIDCKEKDYEFSSLNKMGTSKPMFRH